MGLVISIVTFPFKLIIRTVGEAFDDICVYRSSEEKTSVPMVMTILSLIPILAAAGVLLVSIIVFIATRGYGTQITLIKELGWWEALNSIWTYGTSGFFYKPWLAVPIALIMLAVYIVAMVELYLHGEVWKKIIGTFFTVILLIYLIAISNFRATAFLSDLFSKIEDIDIGPIDNAGFIILLIVFGLSVFVCYKMLSGFMPFVYGLVHTVAYFALAPLLCLIIENFIGFVLFCFLALIMCIVAIFLGGSLGGSGSSDTSGGSDYASDNADRITRLENDIAASKRGLEGHQKGEIGYSHVDERATARRIKEDKAELDRLKNGK